MIATRSPGSTPALASPPRHASTSRPISRYVFQTQPSFVFVASALRSEYRATLCSQTSTRLRTFGSFT
jgi:hypothetical protein